MQSAILLQRAAKRFFENGWGQRGRTLPQRIKRHVNRSILYVFFVKKDYLTEKAERIFERYIRAATT